MQYGSLDKLFGGLTFDLTKNAWRRGGWLDAIVTDPPCKFFPTSSYSSVIFSGRKAKIRRRSSRSKAARQKTRQRQANAGRTISERRRLVRPSVSSLSAS